MDTFEMTMAMKRINERHEELVQQLQLERQLPPQARTNLFTDALNAVKAAFAPAQPVRPQNARRSLATK